MSSEALLASFLAATNEVAELNTEYLLCPELDSVPATIVDYQLKTGMSTAKDGEGEKPWYMLSFQYEVDSAEAREVMARDKVMVYGQPIFLAVEPDFSLHPTNNQGLGRLIKLFDIDMAGLSIKEIFEAFKGQYCSVKVGHRALSMKDKSPLLDDEGNQRYSAEVMAVGKPE